VSRCAPPQGASAPEPSKRLNRRRRGAGPAPLRRGGRRGAAHARPHVRWCVSQRLAARRAPRAPSHPRTARGRARHGVRVRAVGAARDRGGLRAGRRGAAPGEAPRRHPPHPPCAGGGADGGGARSCCTCIPRGRSRQAAPTRAPSPRTARCGCGGAPTMGDSGSARRHQHPRPSPCSLSLSSALSAPLTREVKTVALTAVDRFDRAPRGPPRPRCPRRRAPGLPAPAPPRPAHAAASGGGRVSVAARGGGRAIAGRGARQGGA